jgi:predicted PurR-regulated permease PerM
MTDGTGQPAPERTPRPTPGTGATDGPSTLNRSLGQGGVPAGLRLHLWDHQWFRDVVVVLSIAGIVYAGYWLRDVTVPLLIALALAYLFEPVVRRLCRVRGITRPGAVTLILMTVGVAFTIGLTFTIPLAVTQTIGLVNRVRESDLKDTALRMVGFAPEAYRDELRNAVLWMDRELRRSGAQRGGAEPIHEGGPPTDAGADAEGKRGADQTKDSVAGTPAPPEDPKASAAESPAKSEELLEEIRDMERVRAAVRAELAQLGISPGETSGSSSGIGISPWRILGVLPGTLERAGSIFFWIIQISLVAFLIPFYFWFFSVSYPKIVAFGGSLIPAKHRESTLDLVGKMDRAVSGFVRGRIVICAIMGVLFAIGWAICGVPYAFTVGFFTGAVSLVPYLGGIGLPLAIGLLLFEQIHVPEAQRMAWWAILLWPTVVFVVVQTLESYLLTPAIAGKATDLDPVTIVVAIIAGGSVAGIYGMLLAIPAAACGKILLKEVLLPRLRAWARGEASDPLPLESMVDQMGINQTGIDRAGEGAPPSGAGT